METFSFVPNGQVPVTLPREPQNYMSMNGWNFSSKPTTPYQRKFRVKLFGIRWYLDNNGLYDETTNPTINARALEKFYERHETWNPFTWNHPHLGPLTVRFDSVVQVPEGTPNSSGLTEPFEITLIHHNPAWS